MDLNGAPKPAGSGLTLPVLVAVTALTLTGCVVSDDAALMAGPGFAPGASIPSGQTVLGDSGQSGQLQFASANPSTASISSSSPRAGETNLAETAKTEDGEANSSTLSAMAPSQTDSSSVDALNRGITQTGDIKPLANLYSAPIPVASPRQAEPAPEVAAAAAAPGSITIPVPSPSPNRTAEIVVAKADASANEDTEVADADQIDEARMEPAALAPTKEPKKQSIFARLFNSNPTPPKAVPDGRGKSLSDKSRKQVSPRRNVELASASAGDTLPGVRLASLFEIRSGTDEDGEDARGVEVASAAGLARLAPNGLRTQTDRVDVACLKPALVRVLRIVERHYGKSVVVTSGYRSPKHNRKVGGASHSRHTTCEAADIQVAGVSKWELAKYLRSMPNRGGVGTYCHTKSVHVDIGTQRDWNWRCRRRK